MRLAILSGMPTSCAIVRAISSARAFRPAEIFSRNSEREAGEELLQPSKAARAAFTAASASAALPAGTRPITSPVPALWTSIAWRPEGATQRPPMKCLSRICIRKSLPVEKVGKRVAGSRHSTDAVPPAQSKPLYSNDAQGESGDLPRAQQADHGRGDR